MPTVSDETAKVSTDDAVPCRALAVVELGEVSMFTLANLMRSGS
jgi:hypothetical protein